MKKRVFIGSSIESKELALSIQQALSEDFECILWYEGFFSLGKHYYVDLIQKIITFDYAIMIGGEDDYVKRISNQTEKISPRDNVYLEYGLFSGILSPNKVLLLIHERCLAASDLSGMSLSQYRSDGEAVAIARAWIEGQCGNARRALSRKDVGIMPTVGIAVGYFYNFLKPFIDKLYYAEPDKDVRLRVLIPAFVNDDVEYYKRIIMRRYGLKDTLIQGFRIMIDPKAEEPQELYDVPRNILSLFKTVNYIFEISDGNTDDTVCAKARALDDFYDNLKLLISNDHSVKSAVVLERFDES